MAGLYWLVPYTGGHGPVDPGYGRPGWGGRPDQGLPGYGHPDQGLPGYGHPDQGLPGYGHPGNWVPGSWGGRPDQGLPGGGGHPGNWVPGSWGGRPDQGLPGYGHPDQGLPGGPNYPSQGLPGRPVRPGNLPAYPIYRPDNSLPPGASPKLGLWVVAYLAGKGFVWTPVAPALPEQGLPVPPEGNTPDNTLPEVPPEGNESPPPEPEPK